MLNSAYEILIRNGNDDEEPLVLRGGSMIAALRRLRFWDRPRRIWADQCCINQDDPVERSKQVQSMNRICRDAAHILVWLGLDPEKQAASAFGLVRELDEILRSHCSADSPSPVRNVSELETYLRENQKALQALTNRAWEIGTSTPATMYWGEATVRWDTLASVCGRLKSYHSLRSALGIGTSDISFLYRRFIVPAENTHHANRFNLVYELQRARHLHFSDNGDRVFAFLGHFSARSLHPLGCGPVSIAADYTTTVEQLYIDLAVRILRENPAAAYIVLAAVQRPSSSLPSSRVRTNMSLEEAWLKGEQKLVLPSWVPDWRRSNGIILAEPICPHRAHGDSTAKIEVLEEEDLVLRVHRVEVDTIAACSRRLVSEDFYGNLKRKRGRQIPMVEQLWGDLCRKERFNMDDIYLLTGQTAFFAFMQTLSNGCVQAAGHKSMPYHKVPDRMWLQKAARYIVQIFGASGNVSEEVRIAAEVTQPESDEENWSRWATSASAGRIFARTGRGYYVLGPAALEAEDVVCVLFGTKVPFCLRPMGRRYLLVGECYVHGLMKGEAIEMLAQNELCEKVFDIV
ncbi:heterokaryon incompatibility protein 6,OR allele [Achaetomium macrosporum]|uniref:Heterokaryon incompatibility protein 6,OR allele n=1 Tax=Achaetomium macrosporum TaxID=79813 RepID=A0AAN7C570_9PEZI|nr:heterokaryon incompatibility protein 6,OR allele [Achaetomium macrosporum]